MVPQRTVSFKCRLKHVHPRAYACIINEKTKENSLDNITWPELENKRYHLKRFISPAYYRSQEKSKTMDNGFQVRLYSGGM